MHPFCSRVRSYLEHQDIDTAIVDYLVHVAEDVQDEAMSLDDYVDLVRFLMFLC